MEGMDEIDLIDLLSKLGLGFRYGRQRDESLKTAEHAVELIKKSEKIMVLTGAGISVSCGIPDFRTEGTGLYSTVKQKYPDLPHPTAIFELEYLLRNPKPFFELSKELFPGKKSPSPVHHFLSLLEKKGKLLRQYTQNIDTLEAQAGVTKVVYCHGSYMGATCVDCHVAVDPADIKEDVVAGNVPYCKKCKTGIVKPDIVFFGESLPSAFFDNLENDKKELDLLIVIGSSLKVQPVASIVDQVNPKVPQILINMERVRDDFDIELLGHGDVIVAELCKSLGWELPATNQEETDAKAEAEEETEESKHKEKEITDEKGDSEQVNAEQASEEKKEQVKTMNYRFEEPNRNHFSRSLTTDEE